MQGHLVELAASHTGSRIVQACLKFGSKEQRHSMLKELSPAFLELAKSPYGHFVATKLASTASAEELAGVAFLGCPQPLWSTCWPPVMHCTALSFR